MSIAIFIYLIFLLFFFFFFSYFQGIKYIFVNSLLEDVHTETLSSKSSRWKRVPKMIRSRINEPNCHVFSEKRTSPSQAMPTSTISFYVKSIRDTFERYPDQMHAFFYYSTHYYQVLMFDDLWKILQSFSSKDVHNFPVFLAWDLNTKRRKISLR